MAVLAGGEDQEEPVVLPPGTSLAPDVGTSEERCFATGWAQQQAAQDMLLARGHQGGGATWIELFPGLFRECDVALGDWAPADIVAPGVPRIARFGDVHRPETLVWTWISMDDSAEELLFCSGNMHLTSAVRAEFDRVNHDLPALERLVEEYRPE
ncbi:MAG: hypothetical protein IPG17_19720 [Sandaracinaceae bacterium]|nr:hypothetical protein [Sandaracinaceae bacterium]MBK7151926.1 hypothetical protein [Sandaracinaceae bacterium]